MRKFAPDHQPVRAKLSKPRVLFCLIAHMAEPGDIKGARPDHYLREIRKWVPKEED
jgi:hypothetical protein